MTNRAVSLLLFALVVVVVMTTATTAAAYCRKTTAGGDDCVRSEEALPLYWQRSCVAVRVVVDAELEREGRMTTARAIAIVARATATWRSAQCSGRPVAIEVSSEGCGGEPGARSEIRFSAARAEPGLLGATDVSFDAKTGGISVARVNVPDVYDDLAATSPDDLDARVEGVVRHELGHFLGLAHSDDADAVMNATYDPSRKDGLTADDLAGLCDAYDPAQPIGAGCTIHPSGGGHGAVALVALSLVVLLRRRRALPVAVVLLLSLHASTAEAAKTRTKKKTPARAPAAMTAEDARLLAHDEPVLTSATPMVAYVVEERPPPAPPPPAPVDLPSPPPGPRSEVWLGGRYRASVLPSALVAPVARTSGDLLFHSAAVELEIRRGAFVLAPAVTFADLSTRDLLVGRTGSDLASSLSYVKSDLRAIAASVTLTWAVPLSRRVSLELGAELGVATTLGTMQRTWVHESSDGRLAFGDRRFAPCTSVHDGFGCRPQDHEAGSAIRVGDARERGPVILPWVSLPVVGVRARIGDDVAARLGVGASITGVWIGVAIDYGFSFASNRANSVRQ